ncbi:MAG TPA: hypothetical protein VHC22_30770 [Pirellulales bacterium]|nr:hypothetical protein [Pirellulales bacterium]
MIDSSRVVARLTQDPLAPSPLYELAQLTLQLKQRVEALESTQRAMELRIAALESAKHER